jgi:hypothetical protein
MKRSLSLLLLVGVLGAACASKASGQGTTQSPLSGIEGTVLTGPSCPVLREGSPCPDRPVVAKLTVTNGSRVTILTAISGSDGRFKIGLAPGAYIVSAARPGVARFGQSGPVMVTVRSGAYTNVKIVIDSGIR